VVGRRSDDEVTCFLNSIGTGFQFAVAGALVHERAVAGGVGRDLPTEWFTQERP
jgi:ornithine cyclodeaminase/alanine dehydrogenase-like protein (mu-crystallin family)